MYLWIFHLNSSTFYDPAVGSGIRATFDMKFTNQDPPTQTWTTNLRFPTAFFALVYKVI